MRLSRILIGLCLLSPGLAAAQEAIHRCVSADGHLVFTDRACSDMQATSTQPSARTLQGEPDPGFGAPPPILCAADFAQLKQAVVDAFATADANRLAGLMLWSGEGHRAAVADIRALHALMRHPLVDIGSPADDDPAPSESSDASAQAGAGSALVVRTAAGDGSGAPHETRFQVARQSGCLWLRQP